MMIIIVLILIAACAAVSWSQFETDWNSLGSFTDVQMLRGNILEKVPFEY